MNRDEIIRMAREAGWEKARPFDDCPACGVFDVEHFAALVAAAEREACAKVCDDMAAHYWAKDDAIESLNCEECATAIRARGDN